MRIMLYWEGDILIARLSEMDVGETHREALQVITETQPLEVVIDCSQVRFIASTGIANLVQLVQHIRRCGGRAQVAGLAPPVERVLEMVNLRRWVPFSASVGEAVAGAKSVA